MPFTLSQLRSQDIRDIDNFYQQDNIKTTSNCSYAAFRGELFSTDAEEDLFKTSTQVRTVTDVRNTKNCIDEPKTKKNRHQKALDFNSPDGNSGSECAFRDSESSCTTEGSNKSKKKKHKKSFDPEYAFNKNYCHLENDRVSVSSANSTPKSAKIKKRWGEDGSSENVRYSHDAGDGTSWKYFELLNTTDVGKHKRKYSSENNLEIKDNALSKISKSFHSEISMENFAVVAENEEKLNDFVMPKSLKLEEDNCISTDADLLDSYLYFSNKDKQPKRKKKEKISSVPMPIIIKTENDLDEEELSFRNAMQDNSVYVDQLISGAPKKHKKKHKDYLYDKDDNDTCSYDETKSKKKKDKNQIHEDEAHGKEHLEDGYPERITSDKNERCKHRKALQSEEDCDKHKEKHKDKLHDKDDNDTCSYDETKSKKRKDKNEIREDEVHGKKHLEDGYPERITSDKNGRPKHRKVSLSEEDCDKHKKKHNDYLHDNDDNDTCSYDETKSKKKKDKNEIREDEVHGKKHHLEDGYPERIASDKNGRRKHRKVSLSEEDCDKRKKKHKYHVDDEGKNDLCSHSETESIRKKHKKKRKDEEMLDNNKRDEKKNENASRSEEDDDKEPQVNIKNTTLIHGMKRKHSSKHRSNDVIEENDDSYVAFENVLLDNEIVNSECDRKSKKHKERSKDISEEEGNFQVQGEDFRQDEECSEQEFEGKNKNKSKVWEEDREIESYVNLEPLIDIDMRDIEDHPPSSSSSSSSSSSDGPDDRVYIKRKNNRRGLRNSGDDESAGSGDILDEALERAEETEAHMAEDNQFLKDLVVRIPWDIPLAHTIETRMSSRPSPSQKQKFAELKIPLKLGPYTKEEDKILRANFEEFCKVHDLPHDPKPFLNFKFGGKTLLGIKERINFVQYLGKDLERRMLHSIYRRFVCLCSEKKKGRFTEEEDTIIQKYMSNRRSKYDNRQFSTLSKVLNRDRLSVEKRYKYILSKQKFRTDQYKIRDHIPEYLESLMKILEVGEVAQLKEIKITRPVWLKLAAELKQSEVKVKRVWETIIYPRLFAENPIDADNMMKQLIFKLVALKKTDYRDVNWSKMAAEFENITPAYLYQMFKRLTNTCVPKYKRHSLSSTLKCLVRAYEEDDCIMRTQSKIEFKDGEVSFIMDS